MVIYLYVDSCMLRWTLVGNVWIYSSFDLAIQSFLGNFLKVVVLCVCFCNVYMWCLCDCLWLWMKLFSGMCFCICVLFVCVIFVANVFSIQFIIHIHCICFTPGFAKLCDSHCFLFLCLDSKRHWCFSVPCPFNNFEIYL